MKRAAVRIGWIGAMLGAFAGATVRAEPAASASSQFQALKSLYVAPDETRTGDLYLFANDIEIGGKFVGDLVGFGNTIQIDGEVDGDLFCWAQSLVISGVVRDSVRAGGSTVTVSGTIEGDLLAFGGAINLTRSAHVTGNVRFFGGRAVINGTVDGDVSGTGGEFLLGGAIGGDAALKFDAISLEPASSIAGDLSYTARKAIQPDERAVVGGEVDFRRQKKKEEEPEPLITAGDVVWWFFRVVWTLIVGATLLGLLRRPVMRISETVGTDPLLGGLIGFGSFIMVPVAAVLVSLLVITLPLGIITLLLYVLALIVAKVPVAVWLGGRALGLLGRSRPAPLLGLLIGTLLLYLLFAVPYLGGLLWLATVWLGLGATVLGIRKLLQAPPAGGGAAAPAVEAAAGGPDP